MSGGGQLEIYYDSLQEAKWFQALSDKLKHAALTRIGERGANPPRIERLLRYDRPDIIVAVDGIPKLMVEKTSEVPTGHNVTQRFGRLANAVEEQVMVVYMLPFKAMKHGKYANVCYISARLFMALEKMEEIHGVPVLAVEWPSDSKFELVRDGSEDAEMRMLVDGLVSNNFDFRGLDIIEGLKEKMVKGRIERAKEEPRTAQPPNSVSIVSTESFLDELKNLPDFKSQQLPSDFKARKSTLVYNLGMTPQKCRREDPYTGTQFLYDYLWCRNGKNPSDKHTNLVLDVPLVPKSRWLDANPNDSTRKSAVYYATANVIKLKDGFIICQSKVGPARTSVTLNHFGK